MGNCVFKGFTFNHGHHPDHDDTMVRVVTSNGGIMELYAPITAECITTEFPGHGIFRCSRPGLFSGPMLHSDDLLPGHLYYLLPLHPSSNPITMKLSDTDKSSSATPYRMSTYGQGGNKMMTAGSEAEVVPRYNSTGVWKVKLVISPEQLSEILSQESRTEALIESVRTVAKCGNGLPPSAVNSDQLSVSGSWKGSMSDKMGLDM